MSSTAPLGRSGAGWLAPIEELVVHAAQQIQLLGALTPVDAHRERERLLTEVRSRRPAVPRWIYRRRNDDDLRRALEAAERVLASMDGAPLEALYLARVRELSLEAAMCAAAGTGGFAVLARQRFAPPEPVVAHAARALCDAWLSAPADARVGEAMPSDDPDPRSLLSRMRAAVGRLRLPFAVVTQPALAPLAATGERTILVAAGRLVHEDDARRIVLHEIEGHARPRARSLRARSVLFRAGTARGSDDQEGRAILLEERAGLLGVRRQRQLAARHRAVQAMLDGASFGEVAATLVDVHAVDAAEAVIMSERAFRGSDGLRAGLGRERVYLESLVRVRAHLASRPDDEDVLASGQVAVDAVDALRDLAPGH